MRESNNESGGMTDIPTEKRVWVAAIKRSGAGGCVLRALKVRGRRHRRTGDA